MQNIGTVSIGVKAPIIKRGDKLVPIVADSVIAASKEIGMDIAERDIIAVTEAVVAKAQGNYATIEQVTKSVKKVMNADTVGLVFPILSRNRFLMLLRAISKAVKKIIIQFSFPTDEVGNPFMDKALVYEKNLIGMSFTEKELRMHMDKIEHPFTHIDYVELYKSIASQSCECEVIFSNDPRYILSFTKDVICADIHTRESTKKILAKNGAKRVITLSEILSEPVDGSGFNPEYGIYGSNVATEDTIKLFPRDGQKFVDELQKEIFARTGKTVECMLYGDGAFKDPVGGIWELADPVVSPGFTKGLKGTTNEIKLKYIAEKQIGEYSGDEAVSKMKEIIKEKKLANADPDSSALGTTPRYLSDLVGSLCDLTTGSGDKGTPIVWVKNYFNTFAD